MSLFSATARRFPASTLILACVGVSSTVLGQQPSLHDYVRDHWWGGWRAEVVASYGAVAVPELLAMLRSEEPYWGAVVGMLVALGDERAVDALIAFVERPAANPALWNVYESARAGAIVGLGELARRTGSERALTYLV